MGGVGPPGAYHNADRRPAGPHQEAAHSMPRSRPECDDLKWPCPPSPMLFEGPINQGVKLAGLLITLDLVVPLPFGILRKPGSDAAQLIRRQALDGGGDLLDRAHRHPTWKPRASRPPLAVPN